MQMTIKQHNGWHDEYDTMQIVNVFLWILFNIWNGHFFGIKEAESVEFRGVVYVYGTSACNSNIKLLTMLIKNQVMKSQLLVVINIYN